MRAKKTGKFRSKLESRVHTVLTESKKILRCTSIAYESETLKYLQPSKLRSYYPDFILRKKYSKPSGNFPSGTTPTAVAGGKVYLEVKGRLLASDRTKMLLVRDQNPSERIVFVFSRPDNKLYKGSKTTYADWATANKFEWTTPEKLIEYLTEET